MAKIIRSGKVVVILSGKYAGKKALVIKTKYVIATFSVEEYFWRWMDRTERRKAS